jgi:CxxC-x17-CxxC domain-containing protein
MYTPRRDKRSGGGFRGKKFGERSEPWKKNPFDRDAGKTESFSAVCGACGKDCRVPFRPNGKKPVLCTNCFKKDARTDERGFDPKSSPGAPARNDRDLQEQLRSINTKLDAILNALES